MSRPPPAYPPRSRLSKVSTSGRWAGDAHGEHQRVHSAPPLTVDWDDDDGASTQGGGHYADSVYSDTHHHGDDDPLERLSGESDFSGDYVDSVFSGDSGYTGLSGVSGAFHNRALLPARVKGDPRLDPTDPDYDPNEHLRRLTEGDTVDDADRFSLARGLSLGLGSLALDDGYDAISTFEGTSRSEVSRRSTSRRRDPERKRYGNIENTTNAAETGDAGAIDYVHRHGMDLNAVDEDGRAALHVAAERGDVIVAERLIELGAEPCIEGNLGLTPAHVAAYCGHTDVLDAVLDAGGSTNARDRDGSTPLHWACSAGKIRSVRCLLRRDDVNTGVVNGKGLTARDVSERESCTAAIIEYDATATVHNLAADGKLPIVKRLLDDAWKSNKTTEEVLESVDAAGETMLHHACRNGCVNTVESLYVEYGANPDARSGVDGATPLHLAAAGGHVECIRVYALNAGFPRRLQQRTLMRTTSVDRRRADEDEFDEDDDKARWLRRIKRVGAGGEAVVSGSAPVHMAAQNGHAAAVEFLIDQMHADREAKDDEGSAPLHIAVARGHEDVVECLLRRAAKVDAVDGHGCQPLHLAAERNHTAVIKILLEKGGEALIVARNRYGHLPVHLAAAMGHFEAVTTLLPDEPANSGDDSEDDETKENSPAKWWDRDRGDANDALHALRVAKRRAREKERAARRARRARKPGEPSRGRGVNAGGHLGWTCLHLAAHGCHLELVEHLLQIPGADPSPIDASGATPLHLAAEGGSTAVVEALLSAKGVDSTLRTDAGFTPMHIAAMAGHSAATRMFIRYARDRVIAIKKRARQAADEAKARGEDAYAAAEAVAAEEFAEDDAGEIINLDQPSSSDYTALHLAAMRKHERVVKLLLNEGARVGVVGDDGKTPLHLAAQSGAKAVVKMLLRATKGAAAAVVNDRTNAGETPVLLTAMGGHLDAFDVFMHAGADPFIPDERGNTCMHAACRSGSRDIFVRLLSYASRTHLGMEVFRVPNLAMERPIHLAARNGSVHLVRCLIDRGADLSAGDDHGHNALMAACEADKAGAAALIIDQVKHFGSEVSTDLTMAQMRWRTLKRAMPDLIAADKMGIDPMAENGASEQALIDLSLQRMGISDDGSKMRRSASKQSVGFMEGEDGLLYAIEEEVSDAEGTDTESDLGAKGYSLLAILEKAREQYKVRQRDRYVNYTSSTDGYGALHIAAEKGLTRIVRLLLDSGASPDLPDGIRSNCALHLAAREGHRRTCTMLARWGASQKSTNDIWYTPLHLAAKEGDLEIVEALLDAADAAGCLAEVIDYPRKDGTSPLHSAVEQSHEDVVRTLLNRGANWDARTIRNESVMHVAARTGHGDILKMILKCREDATWALREKEDESGRDDSDAELEDDPLGSRDHTESMPLHWAAEHGHLDAVRALVSAGASLVIGGMWRGSTAAHLAARNGHLDIVRHLHSLGANLNAQDMWNYATPLILAAEGGHTDVVRFLIDRRVRLDVEDKFGTTAAQSARTPDIRNLIHCEQVLRRAVLVMHGATRLDLFLGWRDHVLYGKALRARDSKGTWQMVFALFGEDVTARYYWLWRQWEQRGRRRRRALGKRLEPVVAAMEATPGFAGLSHARVMELAEKMSKVEIDKGQNVFTEGDRGDDAYFVVVKGKVEVYMTVEHEEKRKEASGSDDGSDAPVTYALKETKVASLRSGVGFGDLALRFDSLRMATVRAMHKTTLLRLEREDYLAALREERESMDASGVKKLVEEMCEAEEGLDVEAAERRAAAAKTTVAPEDLVAVQSLPRALEPWERELLATLLTVARFAKGERLPVPRSEADRLGINKFKQAAMLLKMQSEKKAAAAGLGALDKEDGYVGFVISGEIKVTRRVPGAGSFVSERVGPGGCYAALAEKKPGDAAVSRRGAISVEAVSADPVVCAVLQGPDIKALPRSLQELLLDGRTVPVRWDPLPRSLPRSTAEWPRSATEEDTEKAEKADEDDEKDDDDDDDDDTLVIDDHGMKAELVKELTEAFHFVDADHGGDIDENELKSAARALGFEPDQKELKAMFDALDEDGGGSVDLGEFVGKVTERIAEVTRDAALDVGFDCFDVTRKGFIVLEDVAAAAKTVGDNVGLTELDELMNLGEADANDDGEIDRDEFATIMDSHETTAPERRAFFREAIAKQAEEARRADAVAEMLMEYRGGGNLRSYLLDIFANIAGPEKDPETDEIDVRDLIGALKRDSDGDGSLSEMLQLPRRLRFDDGSRDRFETIFREIDTDGSRTIDFGEFFVYFRSLKKERCGEIVRAAIEHVREDEAGESVSSVSDDEDEVDGDDDIAALVAEDMKRRAEDPEGVDAVSAGTAALARRWAKKVHGKEKVNAVVNSGAVAAAAMAQRWQRKTFAHRNE